ncbi:sulfatase-like hydrolase/transferase [Aestuariibacter sp. AA17]|uniref:Sulfatase-like hydrolase/transferase n=1 Tax=Fluctibacter corallii TaxID=2984329 RepID=A0ABT3AA39_9ALTE|nr:sulfatase-like hydrolase/transferase [Aestuariibacter sp. AA17]MCV2885452.1 sulfatase-like hydrolase/transferase [Aestuariibacter sp. AA17]
MTELPSVGVDAMLAGLTTFLFLSGLLRLIKILRGKRGALASEVCLDDLLVLFASSGLLALCYVTSSYLLGIVSLLIVVVGMLSLIDAMLFVQYRIEVNRQTISWFMTGSKGLVKGIPHLLLVFKKYPPALVVTPLLCAYLVLINMKILVPLIMLAIFVLGYVCSRSGSKSLWDTLAMMLSLLTAPMVFYGTFVSNAWVAILCLTTISLLVISILIKSLKKSSAAFLTTPTLLLNFFSDDNVSVDQSVDFKEEHKIFIPPKPAIPEKSRYFGECKGANIILITLESLGAYIPPYNNQGAYSTLLKRFENNTWNSRKHYCLCPNTTVSTNQIYSGAYSNNPYNREDSLYPGVEPKHVKTLKKAGYKTFFLDSANINLYDYHKLLNRIGFDKYWGTDDIPSNGLRADYRIWNMVDELVECIDDSPFFLHLINDQTHMPYEVVDKQRFSRHKGRSAKETYLNAIEESDYIIDEFLTRLGKRIDLSDTLIVFTGDHGESFGEHGYSFHSNSVISQQMQVPFFMHHPNLESKSIEHSCHFDLFPTFFDLLGIETSEPCLGASLGKDDRPNAYFFHSATLKGNTPANFGFLYENQFYWTDRLFNQVRLVDAQGNNASLSKHERSYTEAMLYQMLKARNILA